MVKWFRIGAFRLAGLIALSVLPLLALSSSGWAQPCAGGLISGCRPAVNPQANDLVFGWQIGGSIPHTRAVTNAQVLTGALQSTIIGEIKAQPSTSVSSGLNLGVGIAPTSCIPGDVWETSAGLFSCPAGSPIGPYSVGGSGGVQIFANAGALPAVSAGNNGQLAFVQNCVNGNEGTGTGCLYLVNNVGTWVAKPGPWNVAITVGGQALFAGGATTNQGNGSLLQLASGSFVTGHALAYDANGNAIDSGVPPGGGGGGGGTVTGALQNSMPFYSSAGTATVLSGMTIVNNAVVATDSGGIPTEVRTLPAGLTIPTPTIAGLTATGAISIAAATYTGTQTLAAATTGGASLNMPAGVAPTSPANGDFWTTSSGLFGRINGATQGPYLGSVATTSPLAGGGVGPSLTITCTTCVTSSGGGALTATAPITISAGGLIALGVQPRPLVWIADSATVVHNDNYDLIMSWPFVNGGTVKSVTYKTGGASTPSYTLTLKINGTNITGCSAISVSSSTPATATCSAANTITTGQALTLAITGTTGAPSSSEVQVTMAAPAS